MTKRIIIIVLLTGISYSPYAQDSVQVCRTFKSQKENNAIPNTTFQQLPNMVYDYQKHLAAACKAELYIEKATNIPLRFRVGSIEQSDYLEQKPNSGLYRK